MSDKNSKEEIWKSIGNDGSVYQVSNRGNIRRAVIEVSDNENLSIGYRSVHTYENNGYLMCNILGSTHAIHRLVANQFVPNPDNNHYVIHKDNDKHNNDSDNLKWAKISTTEKRVPPVFKGMSVMCVENGQVYANMKAASLALGVPADGVSRSAYSCGRLKTKGYSFTFVN